MERIVNYIKELLFEHDCVIIPGFGGIITNYEPAYIHPVKNIFRPPSKELAFNASLQQNDGLLVSVCSLKEDWTSTEALEKIHEFVCHIYDEIEEYSSYSIEGIGKFTLNVEHNLLFEPEKGLNYLVQSYELPEFYFKPIVRDELDMKRVPPRPRPVVRRAPVKRAPQAAKTEGSAKVNKDAAAKAIEAKKEASKKTKPEKPAKVKKEKVVKEKVQSDRSANKQPVYIILPVIILIGVIIGGVLGMMNGGDSGHITHEASIVPSGSEHGTVAGTDKGEKEGTGTDKDTEKHDEGENHDNSSDSETDEALANHVEDNEEKLIEEEGEVAKDTHQDEEIEDTTPVEKEESMVKEEATHDEVVDNSSSSDIISSPSGRFYIIAGSFGDKSNADKLINRVGSSARVVRKGNAGLYNVAVKSYGSWQAAKSDLSTYTGEYGSGIWIMKY